MFVVYQLRTRSPPFLVHPTNFRWADNSLLVETSTKTIGEYTNNSVCDHNQ